MALDSTVTWQRYLPDGTTLGYTEYREKYKPPTIKYFRQSRKDGDPAAKLAVEVSKEEFFRL